jgi:hypothetical protein
LNEKRQSYPNLSQMISKMRALDARREFEIYMTNSELNHGIKEHYIGQTIRKMPHNHLLDLFLMFVLIERENDGGQNLNPVFEFETSSNLKAIQFYNKLDFYSNSELIEQNRLFLNNLDY